MAKRKSADVDANDGLSAKGELAPWLKDRKLLPKSSVPQMLAGTRAKGGAK